MERKLRFVVCMLVVLTSPACSRDRTPPASHPSLEPSPSIQSVLPELTAFVERARGRQFVEEVKVRVLSEPPLAEELNRFAADPERVARTETVLTILGLLPPEADLAGVVAASDQSRAGFYDPVNDELVIGNELTPFLRGVLVHELAHALDDQHFEIGREVPGDQAAAAFRALVEGSAVWVERRYVTSLPEAEQKQVEAEQERIQAGTRLPPAVEQLVGFPRLFGPPFVETLTREGPERLDQAFSSPPTTLEQVLEPARYLSGDAPREVRPPHTEGAIIDQGEIGPVLLRLLLESKLEPAVAEEAATGWDGDRYATWRSPDGRTCLRAQFALDTPEDARQLEAALAEWVRRVTDREVDSAGLLLKACGLPSRAPDRSQPSE